MEVKIITKSHKLAKRIDHLPRTETFIILKGHEDNLYNKASCRLINPTRNELGNISKEILGQINQEILKKTDVNHWKNTTSVINWFNKIENKRNFYFHLI